MALELNKLQWLMYNKTKPISYGGEAQVNIVNRFVSITLKSNLARG